MDAGTPDGGPVPNQKELICRDFVKPSDGLEPSTPSLPCAPEPLPWVASGCRSACLSRFRSTAICDRLPPVAPAGLHKCSILRAGIADGQRDSDVPHQRRRVLNPSLQRGGQFRRSPYSARGCSALTREPDVGAGAVTRSLSSTAHRLGFQPSTARWRRGIPRSGRGERGAGSGRFRARR